ncbi:MAG: PD-(D/E)XK nuclease family protein, partial [Bacteroidales bacterium]|nr:PD-(D/E)XK nuclease family protein [Bacteroidales bacterium]
EFADHLQQLVNEIFNCEKFEPKPNDYCKYCDFYELCNADK